jgi:phosphoribosyl 1,2-cyclic phosphodiesterase
MELTILGSSSKGNCYVLQNETEALVIECGISFKEVKKAVDFNIRKIVGAIVSHEHLDHSSAVNDFLNSRISVFASKGTVGNLKLKGSFSPFLLEVGKKVRIGNFEVLPFDVKHDCAEPLGFVIKHEETGNILFATDTYFLPYTFENINNILIEANYRTDILQRNIERGRIPELLRSRTLQSHMSLETCKEALQANDLSKVNNIVLIHLSDGNSNAEEFKQDVFNLTRKSVHIADAGMKINFNKSPF